MEILKLGSGAVKITVMIEPLQTPQDLLPASGHQDLDMIGQQKPVSSNVPENVVVALSQPYGNNG